MDTLEHIVDTGDSDSDISDMKYRLALSAIGDPIHIIDRDYVIRLINPAFIDWLKDLKVKSDILNKKLFEVFQFLSSETMGEYEQVFSSGEPLHSIETINLNNTEIVTETRKVPIIHGGNVVQIVTLVRDITQQKIAEKTVRESEERYRLMADSIQDGLTILEEFQVVYANDRACEIFGYPREEFLTMDTLDLVAPDDIERVQLLVENTMKSGTSPSRLDFWSLRKDSDRRYVSNRISYTTREDGTTLRYIVTTDMTEQKLAEEKLAQQAWDLNERVKELTCLHETTRLLASEKSFDEVFSNMVSLVQSAMQFPDVTCVKTAYLHQEYTTPNFEETPWSISKGFQVAGENVGEMNIYYTKELPLEDHGPFLKEEVVLLEALAEKIGSYLERKITQHALAFSENKYRTVVETAASVIVLLRINGEIKEFNQEAERILGYKLEEVIGKNYFDLFVPQIWHSDLKKQFMSIVKGAFEHGFEYPIRTRDSSFRTFIWNSSLIVDQQGHPSILGIGQDITVRKHAEDALKESEERYRYLFDNLADGVAIVDPDGIITMCNDTLLKMFGFTSDETIGKPFTRFLHSSYREVVFSEFKEGLSTNTEDLESFEVIALHKDGTQICIHVSNTLLYENGIPTGYQSVLRDITQEKKSERRILEERDLAQRYLDIAGAAIVVLDNEGTVGLINQKGSEILGCSIHDVLGKNWFDNFVPSNIRTQAKEVFLKLLEGNNGNLESNENPVLTSEGDTRIIEWRNSVIYNSNGIPIGTMSSGVDVTERRSAEVNLQNTADTAMLYLDIMGHDIRNHLQAIVMGTDIMGHYELGAEIDTIFELIVDSVENSQKLIDQVQATRELLSTPLKQISLLESISECISNTKDRYDDVDFRIKLEVDRAEVIADDYLKLLCSNLVNNAIEHNRKKDRCVWIRLEEDNSGYLVIIEDNGPGISDERKESLFDAGRRFGGIGIHQAKNIVEKYGGTLTVGDRVDGDASLGALFSFWIPKTKDSPNGV